MFAGRDRAEESRHDCKTLQGYCKQGYANIRARVQCWQIGGEARESWNVEMQIINIPFLS